MPASRSSPPPTADHAYPGAAPHALAGALARAGVGMRHDKVVRRVAAALATAWEPADRDAMLIVALAAPLRQPARLVDMVLALAAAAPAAPAVLSLPAPAAGALTRLALASPRIAPRVVVLVHNPAPPPETVARLAAQWLIAQYSNT